MEERKKLNIDSENVVIGSHTLEEAKFQTLNFMDMLSDNIWSPNDQTCMTIDVVTHNLRYEIKRAIELSKCSYVNVDYIHALIGAIQINLEHVNKRNKKHIISVCNEIWLELLRILTIEFHLKYTLE